MQQHSQNASNALEPVHQWINKHSGKGKPFNSFPSRVVGEFSWTAVFVPLQTVGSIIKASLQRNKLLIDIQMASRKEAVEVTWEDQKGINAFADLIRKHTVLKATLDDKKKRCEHLDEAQTELMLVDEEDSTRFLIGECFLHIPNDDADQRLGTEMAQLQKEIQDLETQEAELQSTRDELKQKLYSKFGDQINLDE